MKKPFIALCVVTAVTLQPTVHAQTGSRTNQTANRGAGAPNFATQETNRPAPTADLSMERIRTNAASIKEYIDLLAHPEQSTRLAAFHELTNSRDISAQEAAFAAAFASDDMALRSLALKRRLMRAKVLAMRLTMNDSQATRTANQTFAAAWIVNAHDEQSGTLLTSEGQRNRDGQDIATPFAQIQGIDLAFTTKKGSVLDDSYGCRGKLTLQSDTQSMTGPVECYVSGLGAGWFRFKGELPMR